MKMSDKKILEKHVEKFQSMKVDIEGILDRLNDEFGSKSEKWQDSEKGVIVSEQIDALEDFDSDLDNLIDVYNTLLE